MIFIALPAVLLSAETDIAALETEIYQLDSTLTAFQQQSNQWTTQADDLARQISELKRDASLNFIERQRLESRLKESLKLTQAIEALQPRIKQTQKELREKRSQLIGLYDQRLEALLNALHAKPDKQARQLALAEMNTINRKRAALQNFLITGIPPAQQPGPLLKIEETDTPQSLKRKGDFMKDQQERYQSYAWQLGETISGFEKELTLRQRMSDFMNDLSLFDHQDEALQASAEAGAKALDAGVATYDENQGRWLGDDKNQIQPGAGNLGYLPGAEGYAAQREPLSNADLETLIKELKSERATFQQFSDSLGARADTFYQAIQSHKLFLDKK